jgi:hypothetical protein
MKAKATMLLKTKIGETSDLAKATIAMKTQYLKSESHDVYENKTGYSKDAPKISLPARGQRASNITPIRGENPLK